MCPARESSKHHHHQSCWWWSQLQTFATFSTLPRAAPPLSTLALAQHAAPLHPGRYSETRLKKVSVWNYFPACRFLIIPTVQWGHETLAHGHQNISNTQHVSNE